MLYTSIPHPGQQDPVVEDIFREWAVRNPLTQGIIALARAMVAVFALTSIRLLVLNLGRFAEFCRQPG